MKKKFQNKALLASKLFPLVFGIVVFWFFAFVYPFHLNYQEQYQMFLFSKSYFAQLIAKPGGFCDYLGSFFTQFFFYSWIGAIIIAVLFVFLQQLIWLTAKKLGATIALIPATFIPSLLYWGLLCDENYLLGGAIAMLLTAAFVFAYTLWKQPPSRMAFLLISIPVLYWLAGGAFLLLPLFAIAFEMTKPKTERAPIVLLLLGSLLLSVVPPIACKYLFLQYPMSRVWIGTNYFRFPVNVPISVGITGILIIAIPIALHFFSAKVKAQSTTALLLAQLAVLILGGFFFIQKSVDMEKEEVMAYDFNVRMRKWDRVIALADKKAPSSPLSVTCLNLALAKQDLLGERMFNYYQNGIQGLMPDFVRDYTIPMIAGEVYYQLGFINTAQRYAFEAMEALPDYQKSVRSVMRLAETNLINGNYAVAEKYMHLLQQTFYYRNWATKALQTIKSEDKIDQHPEWGWLRKCRVKDDFLFSEGEKDMMLGIFFSQNNQNRMAFEYLMAFCLLTKDMQHFLQYFPLASSVGYKVIPKSYQEALIYAWTMTNKDPSKEIPYPINNSVKQNIKTFMQIYSSQRDSEAALQDHFSNTFWYYLYFRK